MPLCPSVFVYLWEWYLHMRRRCAQGGFGLAPFSWADLAMWERYTGHALVPFELEIFDRLDVELLRVRKRK